MIFNIQRFSTHDGNGIRTIIFFKGCPLRCLWCCNPESQSFDHSLLYDASLCRSFGDCIKVDPGAITRKKNNGIQIDRAMLKNPLELKDICTAKALTLSGEVKSITQLMLEVEKDLPFYREGGGVTLSGGEPLSQDDDLLELLKALRNRAINVNVETSLHVGWERIQRCIGLVDTFLVDLKHTDGAKFKTFTKGDVDLVLQNLTKLAERDTDVVVRIPVIPGFNHTQTEMNRMVEFVTTLRGVAEIHFLPYHTFGVSKYGMLGMEYTFGHRGQVMESELASYVQVAQSKGLKTKIGG